MMEPKFLKNTSFLQNAKDFFKNRFINNKKEVLATTSACSSIWGVGIVNCQGNWGHQILGAVLYTCSGPPEQSSFIEYIAVKESSQDKNVELHPVISPEVYCFKVGGIINLEDKLVTLNDIFLAQMENPGALNRNHVGGKILGVVLLSLVQCLSFYDEAQIAPKREECCTLYLQANIPTFTYHRYCRIGFTYSTIHAETLDGSPNPNWPLCTNPLTDLPPDLGSLVKSYCDGEDAVNMRLLTMVGTLVVAYPPMQLFGSPHHMQQAGASKIYEDL
jgi:hypothetical protein